MLHSQARNLLRSWSWPRLRHARRKTSWAGSSLCSTLLVAHEKGCATKARGRDQGLSYCQIVSRRDLCPVRTSELPPPRGSFASFDPAAPSETTKSPKATQKSAKLHLVGGALAHAVQLLHLNPPEEWRYICASAGRHRCRAEDLGRMSARRMQSRLTPAWRFRGSKEQVGQGITPACDPSGS
jgi:hypothetical protein